MQWCARGGARCRWDRAHGENSLRPFDDPKKKKKQIGKSTRFFFALLLLEFAS